MRPLIDYFTPGNLGRRESKREERGKISMYIVGSEHTF